MENTLHIITPCTRPHNLVSISKSIKPVKGWKINWYIIFDSYKERPVDWSVKARMDIKVHFWYVPTFGKGVVGHDQRNKALDLIEDGYIYQLDDDNILHPDIYTALQLLNGENAVIVSQQLKDLSTRLIADPVKVEVNNIDNAQYILPRGMIADNKYELVYHADGLFIQHIYDFHKKDFFVMPQLFSYYNYLR